MGITGSKVYDLEDQIVVLQREVKQLKDKMGKPNDTVENLEKDMQKQKQLTFQLDGFARETSAELFKQPRLWSGNGDKPVAYIGPSRNLKPEVRRYLTPLDKQYILNRQGSRCNSCADHIVGVSRGGRTTLENMQLLCVQDHRAKSAREAQGGLMTIDIDLAPSDTNVYIFASETVQFPVDKRTPLEAITKGCGLSLLAFKKVDRTWVEVDFGKMLDKFVYKPRIAC